jgi:outer membrane lipoprotein-sorting protein
MCIPKENFVRISGLSFRPRFALVASMALFALTAVPVPSPAQAAAPRTLTPAWTQFTQTWSDLSGYSATVTVFEQKGTQTENMVLDYSYHKPSSATMRIVQGKNAGVTLVWNGGSTMQAHRGSGLMASFKKTMAIDDPLATTVRGSTIDQLSFDAILAHAQQTPGSVAQLPGAPIDGLATDEVRLIPTNAENDGLTLEVVDVSKTTHLPVRILGYDGPVLVRSIVFSDVKLQPQT